MNDNQINFLDNSYARLESVTGTDLTTVNSARVSYDKKVSELSEKDERLIRFLIKHQHTSPFRHAFLTFEIYVPLFVARQHWKHIIGSGFTEDHAQDPFVAWNESSRRYVSETPEFYVPSEWRYAPENSKQGSGGIVPNGYGELGEEATQRLIEYQQQGVELYERSMKLGIAPEQARLFLPAYGLQIRYYWSASLQGVIHFLKLRLGKDAQSEIQDLAQAVLELTKEHFPVSVREFLKQEGIEI